MASFPKDKSTRKSLVYNANKGRHVARPLNAFFIFSNLHRQQLQQRMPHLNTAELSKYLGDLWSKMTQEHKELYFEEARKDSLGIGHGCSCQDCSCNHGTERTPERRKKSLVRNAQVQNFKFGGYVPPFHIFSSQLKRLQKMKELQSQQMKNAGALPDFKTFTYEYDRVVPKTTYMSVPLSNAGPGSGDNFPRPRNVGDDGTRAATSLNIVSSTTKNSTQCKQPAGTVLQDNTYACSSNAYQRPQTLPDSQHTMSQRQSTMSHSQHAISQSQYNIPQSQHNIQQSQHNIPQSQHAIPQTQHNILQSQHNILQCRIPSSTNQQAVRMKPNPRRGQKRIWMESYNSGQAKQEVIGEEGEEQDEETNYVLIPCDVSIAKMLGWPVHMLQKVSKSMLERFKAEIKVSSDNDPLPVTSVPVLEAKTALVPHIQASGDNVPGLPPCDTGYNGSQRAADATVSMMGHYTAQPEQPRPVENPWAFMPNT